MYVAPALSLSDIYGNYGDDISDYLLQKNVLEYPQVGDGQSNTKTNTILTELLAELRRGHIIELDGGVVAGRTRRIANAYTRSQGEPYFEI